MNEDNDVSSNPLSEDHLPGAGESATRDEQGPLDPSEETDTPYQDDLDTDDTRVDPIMDKADDNSASAPQ